jgi:hypothetical protein
MSTAINTAQGLRHPRRRNSSGRQVNCEVCDTLFTPARECGRVCSIVCRNRLIGITKTTHGSRPKRLFRIWEGMKARCHSSSASGYRNYGARGISVCEEWRKSFTAFRAWAFANGYSSRLEIDRKKNHLGYDPDNCRWVTKSVNSRNKRKTRNRTSPFRGVSKTKDGTYRAQMSFDSQKSFLGDFRTALEAALVYDRAVFETTGDVCALNFPERYAGKGLNHAT